MLGFLDGIGGLDLCRDLRCLLGLARLSTTIKLDNYRDLGNFVLLRDVIMVIEMRDDGKWQSRDGN